MEFPEIESERLVLGDFLPVDDAAILSLFHDLKCFGLLRSEFNA